MLVLKRKVGEEIVLTTARGELVFIKILSIDRNVTSVGIGAPISINIRRLEVDDLRTNEDQVVS